jgi:ABC-2 type transport system permease protein
MTSPSMLVARREVIQRVRRRSFLVFTALLVALVLAGGVIAAVVGGDSTTEFEVGVVSKDATGDLNPAFEATPDAIGDAGDVTVTPTSFDDAEQALVALGSGDVDVIVDLGARSVTWQDGVDAELASIVDTSWRAWSAATAARAAGLDDSQVRSIVTPEPLSTSVVDPDDDDVVGLLVGFASAVLLFISITSFGGYVLTGVVEEKSTGVVEVLLSHVRAHQLMAGKVVGIGVVALLQFSATVAAALVALRISGTDVPSEVWVGLPATIGWFIGGFLLYSTLFALAGSFVSRMEDAQGAAAPITTAFTIGYILVFTFGSDPSSVGARVLSVLPPFAPLLMPLRMVTGAASIVEIVVAAMLLALSVVGMIRLAGSVYARTLLHRGSRLTWRDALRRPEKPA